VGRDAEAIAEVVAVYRESLPADLDALEEALGAGDLEQAQGLAHRLKGGTANLGGERLRQVCVELEEAAGSGASDFCGALLIRARTELEALLQALHGVPGSS